MFHVISSAEQQRFPNRTVKFEGEDYGSNVSFFLIDNEPGEGPGLHVHPYPETWIVRGGEAEFYRLSSLRWWPDRRLSRRGLEIIARRAPRGDEFDIMTEAIVILELGDAAADRPDRRRGYEMALDRGALTAFLSWLESRPSPRARRRSA